MISPLEPLHPDGRAAVVVHGAAGAPALESAPASARGDSGPGVVVLAPSRAERRRAEWVAEAARLAASVDRDGLVVAARPGRRLGAQLARCGL
ncbi:MAG TPA: hypothetical protein VNB64_10470, partial [Solirubrobacteraceae bacterium]|nr:hypothetical protein [Solirubrobacteraceae bacterium]